MAVSLPLSVSDTGLVAAGELIFVCFEIEEVGHTAFLQTKHSLAVLVPDRACGVSSGDLGGKTASYVGPLKAIRMGNKCRELPRTKDLHFFLVHVYFP